MRFMALASVLGLLVLPVAGGTLRLGPPVVSNDEYRFPVYLQGDAEGVAALDFRLAYDPAVFRPVSAQSGPSAASAQKQVSSNVASPGEFVVVMMGFNQNAVAPGHVMEIVLHKQGEPSNGQSILRISEPTMATADGSQIDSRGLARTVEFGHGKGEEDDNRDPDASDGRDRDDDDDGIGQTPESEGLKPAEAPRKPAGSVPFIIAGRDGGEGGFAGRVPVGGGASSATPNGAPRGTTEGEGASMAPSIPDGNSAPDGGTASAPAGGGLGGGGSAGGAPAGEVSPVSTATATATSTSSATIVEGERDANPAPKTADGDTRFPRGVAILLILGLAPIGLFMVYKVLQR